MNDNSYVGREYLTSLLERNLKVDVLSIGTSPETDSVEEERCGGKWKPKVMGELTPFFALSRFPSLTSTALFDFLSQQRYDLAIQGGTGIIKQPLIEQFEIGIFNFHPGDLPTYRGCSAPEWQLLHGKPVVCTCHLIDEGIDSGPVYTRQILTTNQDDYCSFRASIYPEIARFQSDTINTISRHGELLIEPVPQSPENAVYRKYIGEELLSSLKSRFPLTQRPNVEPGIDV